MKFKPCDKCGGLHTKEPFCKDGKWWCGHCGGKITKSRSKS